MADFYEGPTGRRRLLRTYEDTRTGCFDDLLYCCAVTVEDALLLGGAIPGVDYTRIKLFELAMPVALSRADSQTLVTTGVPDSHPGAGLPTTGRPEEEEVMHALLDIGKLAHANQVAGRLKRPVLSTLNQLIKKKHVAKYQDGNEVPKYYLTEAGCMHIGRRS